MTVERLHIWLDATLVAYIELDGLYPTLTYTDDSIARFGQGAIVLSASLPVRKKPYDPQDCRPWLEGLLPEGAARPIIEQRFNVLPGDSFHLLAAIGRDCAGAASILPASERAPSDTHEVRSLSLTDLARLIEQLPVRPLGIDDAVRLSLAGVQEKLLLVKDGDGWALPLEGTPSTHILKPEPVSLQQLVSNEAFGLEVAERVGLSVAPTWVERVGERHILVTERYDRTVVGGQVRRIHQEDGCQALGVLPHLKYEQQGGPSLERLADLIRRISIDVRADLEHFMRWMTLNVVLGNADAHGRNVSFVYRNGARLAPSYDVIPTIAYPNLDRNLAMRVNDVSKLDDVSVSDLVSEAMSWRLSRQIAQETINDVIETLPSAIVDAANAVGGTPAATTELCLARAKAFHVQLS